MNKEENSHFSSFEQFIEDNGWKIVNRKNIDHGYQVTVADGIEQIPVNFFTTGTISVQGKACELKTRLAEWANFVQAKMSSERNEASLVAQNRISKYFVIADKIEKIRQMLLELPGEKIERQTGGLAELYRIEVREGSSRVTLTQYESGVLMAQGRPSPLFDIVCDQLDQHLSQSFADRAARYIIGEDQRAVASAYLDKPESENEAYSWLQNWIDLRLLSFLYENDRRTLLAAAGVRNAFQNTKAHLPDYSVIVMPFAKSFEGFLIRLAVHLELSSEDAIRQEAKEIVIGQWIEEINKRIPDSKRYGEVCSAIEAAWQSRNKVMHSDFAYRYSVLRTLAEAEQEILIILRAMMRAYHVFVEDRVVLGKKKPESMNKNELGNEKLRFEKVDREGLRKRLQADGLLVKSHPGGKKNEWGVIEENLKVIAPKEEEGIIVVSGSKKDDFVEKYKSILEGSFIQYKSTQLAARIGVDESGKGDLFGPLVVAGVVLTNESEIVLARNGIRDSKTLSTNQIEKFAKIIRANCPVEALILTPLEYNSLYDKHGRNLNRLLAWGHAQVIIQLNQRHAVEKVISDQFGEASLLLEALEAEECKVVLEQHPHAESDLAVAAASIIARAEFLSAIRRYSSELKLEIPLGSSSIRVREAAKQIYQKWGWEELKRFVKSHFKTIEEIRVDVEK